MPSENKILVEGPREVRGILAHGIIVETEDELIGYAGGTRVIIRIDESLPSLVCSEDLDEIGQALLAMQEDDQ